jgi:3-oxoacyl-[acyl-carrier-protein] synthase-3
MSLPELWVSPPKVWFPSTVLTNEDILGRVRAAFTGDEAERIKLERRIRSLWRACQTDRRAWSDQALSVAPTGAIPAQALLDAHGLTGEDLDLVTFASFAREYYEPATAAELAAAIGAPRALAYDTMMACAGTILSIQQIAGHAAITPRFRRALISTATISHPGHVTYALQQAADVDMLGAGLTLGHAASALMVSRERPVGGGGRVVATLAEGLSEHHALCRAPVHGHFVSDGVAMFALAYQLPDHWRRVMAPVGWDISDVDLFVAHQPSDTLLRGVARVCKVPNERVAMVHHAIGNCAESSVPAALDRMLAEGRLKPGMKVVLSAAASGFAMATVLVEWG